MQRTIKEFLELAQIDNEVIIDAWYDWFCKDTSLLKKGQQLAKKLKQIVDVQPKINQNTTYVFFKNNCPMRGNLYDDFRICDVATGDVLLTIIPRTGHQVPEGTGKSEVWGRADLQPDSEFVEIKTGSWKEVTQAIKEL